MEGSQQVNTDIPHSIYEWIPWAIAGLTTAVSGLAGMIYRSQEKRIAALEETCKVQQGAIDECTKDRESLRVEVAVLAKDVEHLKSKV